MKQFHESFASSLYSLDNNDINIDDINAIKNILNNDNGIELYVLKSQREGGGYKFYGTNLYNKLINNIYKKLILTIMMIKII